MKYNCPVCQKLMVCNNNLRTVDFLCENCLLVIIYDNGFDIYLNEIVFRYYIDLPEYSKVSINSNTSYSFFFPDFSNMTKLYSKIKIMKVFQ